MQDTDKIEAVMRYHERPKHHFNRNAPGPEQLDRANQPNPFRRYHGARLVRLPMLGPDEEPVSPPYQDLYRQGSVPSAPLTLRSLSRWLEYALAISAWKQAGGVRWAELDSSLMVRSLPGIFLAGEMIDWEAPTGGYLMQGCFATGSRAACGALEWLRKPPTPVASDPSSGSSQPGAESKCYESGAVNSE